MSELQRSEVSAKSTVIASAGDSRPAQRAGGSKRARAARRHLGLLAAAAAVSLLAAAGCGDNHQRGLDDFLPEIPDPTGEPQSVYAGTVTADNAAAELMPGAAASGIPGDLYIRNARGRYVVQAANRIIGVVPQGGNLVDAQPIGPDGPIGDEQFGELSAIYILGRTCEHDRVEVVQDGSGGGAAAIIARGKSAANDFFNLKGMGIITIPSDLDPDIPDEIECATTYILHPDSPTLEVYWTFYNASDRPVRGPFAAFSDSGGAVDTWNHGRGFERVGIESLSDPDLEPSPTEYAVFQGPGVAYGLVPQYAADAALRSSASILITGVSIVIYGTDELFDFLRPEGTYFSVEGEDGVTHGVHFIVGQDAADIEEVVRAGQGALLHALSGRVTWASGGPVAGARVGIFLDGDGDGEVGGEDVVVSYADADADGRFSARLAAGSYLARADLRDRGRSASLAIDLEADRGEVALEIADLVRFDYTVVDDETGEVIPARIAVVGANPAAADSRLFSTSDSGAGVADLILAVRGTSVDLGDGADRPIALAPGGRYRVIATRGTEWSAAGEILEPAAGDPDGAIELRLRRVVDTAGYLATEYHVHSVGSFDSSVDWPTRIASAVANGVELFASTEHDYVADLQPLVEELGLAALVRVLPGTEVTPFAYGHFNGYPLERDPASPSGGAIDWARGAEGFALTPREVFDQLRAAGAQLIQVNHPRSAPGALDVLQYFDRAGLEFDYDARTIGGDLLTQPVPNEWLRLPPGESMWDLSFNALEVWNQLGMKDSNGDGRREPHQLDVVMKDWFNLVSFGFAVVPLGNSDTHSIVKDSIGVPRTMVRIGDDSSAALEDGGVVAPLLDTLLGRGDSPHDVVITNGPMIRVVEEGEAGSAIGRVVAGAGGSATLSIAVQSPRWAHFDTIEVFANAIPDIGSDDTIIQPIACFTVVPEADLPPEDPCAQAPLGSAPLDVNLVAVAPGFQRHEASASLTLSSADPIYPEGGTGEDVWVVVRVRGDRAVYPLLLEAIDGDNLATLVSGSQAEVEAALDGIGVTATAFTAPIYLDLDGGGYRARFEPE